MVVVISKLSVDPLLLAFFCLSLILSYQPLPLVHVCLSYVSFFLSYPLSLYCPVSLSLCHSSLFCL